MTTLIEFQTEDSHIDISLFDVIESQREVDFTDELDMMGVEDDE